MKCSCGGDSIVIDSRPKEGTVRRRRRCLTCSTRWSTTEERVHLDINGVPLRVKRPAWQRERELGLLGRCIEDVSSLQTLLGDLRASLKEKL